MGTQKSQRGRGGRRGRGRSRGGGRGGSSGGCGRRRNGLGSNKKDDGFIGFDDYDMPVFAKERVVRQQHSAAAEFYRQQRSVGVPAVSQIISGLGATKPDPCANSTKKQASTPTKANRSPQSIYRTPVEFVRAVTTKSLDLQKPMVVDSRGLRRDPEIGELHLPDHERDGLGHHVEPGLNSGVTTPELDSELESEAEAESESGSESESKSESKSELGDMEDRVRKISGTHGSSRVQEHEGNLGDADFEAKENAMADDYLESDTDERLDNVKKAFAALAPSHSEHDSESESESEDSLRSFEVDDQSSLGSEFASAAEELDDDDIERLSRLDPFDTELPERDWRWGDDDGSDVDSAEELLRELINSGRQAGSLSRMVDYLDEELSKQGSAKTRKRAATRASRRKRTVSEKTAEEYPPSMYIWSKYPSGISIQEVYEELCSFVKSKSRMNALDSDSDDGEDYNAPKRSKNEELCICPLDSDANNRIKLVADAFGFTSTKRKYGKLTHLVLVPTKRLCCPVQSGILGRVMSQRQYFVRTDWTEDTVSEVKEKASNTRKRAHVREGTIIGASAKKIADDNIGHRLLQHMGWTEGEGLGSDKAGIVAPISATMKLTKRGVGTGST